MNVTIRQLNFQQESDRDIFLSLLDHYACGPFGNGGSLGDEVMSVLADRFAACPATFSFVAELASDDGTTKPIGLANCQEGFSTFKAKPRINIHDLVVHESARGKGIGRKLLQAVRDDAAARDACAVTLEVRVDNHAARGLYESFGFQELQIPLKEDATLFGVLKI